MTTNLVVEPRGGIRCWVRVTRGVLSGEYPIDAIMMALRALDAWGCDETTLGSIVLTRAELERMREAAVTT